MNASVLALIVYVSWMILLLGILGSLRVGLTLTGKRAPMIPVRYRGICSP